jgi:hypothetical protein
MAIGAVLGFAPASAVPNGNARALKNEPPRFAAHTVKTAAGALVVTVSSGPLSISTDQSVLTLERAPGRGRITRYRGVLPRVRVIDMRGSLVGWDATIVFLTSSYLHAEGVRISMHPGRPVVVSGDRKGVRADGPEWADFGTPVSLFGAESGSGAGTYDEDALVELVLPFASDARSITLGYEVTIS